MVTYRHIMAILSRYTYKIYQIIIEYRLFEVVCVPSHWAVHRVVPKFLSVDPGQRTAVRSSRFEDLWLDKQPLSGKAGQQQRDRTSIPSPCSS